MITMSQLQSDSTCLCCDGIDDVRRLSFPSVPNGVSIHLCVGCRHLTKMAIDGSPPPMALLPAVATTDAAKDYAQAVVDLINDLTGRYFKVTAETVTRAKALLRARIKVERMLAIVRFMAGKWSPDPKMREYVQPSTLMRVSNAKKYGEAMDAGPARVVGATAGFKMLGDE